MAEDTLKKRVKEEKAREMAVSLFKENVAINFIVRHTGLRMSVEKMRREMSK